jgi:hypothetical protein
MTHLLFFVNYTNPPVPSAEACGGEEIVEKAGYISTKQRIESLILAGQRLVAFRKEQFDFEDDDKIDETFEDVTRAKNFDLADASQIAYALEFNNKQKVVENSSIEESSKESGGDVEEKQGGEEKQ